MQVRRLKTIARGCDRDLARSAQHLASGFDILQARRQRRIFPFSGGQTVRLHHRPALKVGAMVALDDALCPRPPIGGQDVGGEPLRILGNAGGVPISTTTESHFS
jgi:hypothetical protein